MATRPRCRRPCTSSHSQPYCDAVHTDTHWQGPRCDHVAWRRCGGGGAEPARVEVWGTPVNAAMTAAFIVITLAAFRTPPAGPLHAAALGQAPRVPRRGRAFRLSAVAARHLHGHRSGLPMWPSTERLWLADELVFNPLAALRPPGFADECCDVTGLDVLALDRRIVDHFFTRELQMLLKETACGSTEAGQGCPAIRSMHGDAHPDDAKERAESQQEPECWRV
eukprot:NODE_13867_length_1142_cov_3.251232.p1 GENE.NODE_13867_length_1142_cov_3.251232~~NODE_13867_length_1142_cov_3.251232.p1  ORF type:complete len:223 (+),score=31.62 NODE_13867_length_1142_cov_3.251232:335-1003(+)